MLQLFAELNLMANNLCCRAMCTSNFCGPRVLQQRRRALTVAGLLGARFQQTFSSLLSTTIILSAELHRVASVKHVNRGQVLQV